MNGIIDLGQGAFAVIADLYVARYFFLGWWKCLSKESDHDISDATVEAQRCELYEFSQDRRANADMGSTRLLTERATYHGG